ncbi:hypothetical protein [cf. Phormidesmis sp. LEGE 11477]|uniref:hypothetical protein n=1 Tax=cf. Phormidesmis sp. LEGE 11477 TaxID=1828680 RepID=UPI00187E3C42|nr:hypothetical protein [cf. Phormidesmis sp. LEGE 11477]MBE9062882.1 hypothetical protein [cf. Phormidesmis sp. LEGE 11477]
MHPFLDSLTALKPRAFRVQLDGEDIYKAEFTDSGVNTVFEKLVDLNVPRHLLTVFFDDIPTPVYSIALNGEVG